MKLANITIIRSSHLKIANGKIVMKNGFYLFYFNWLILIFLNFRLGFVDFQSGKMRVRNPNLNSDSLGTDFSYEDCLMQAELIFDQASADNNRV